MPNHTKLELTWIGKENRPRLEPRILLPDSERSYHAPHRVTDHDLFDNRLIFGDNLLALKALEQELYQKVQFIYIDPPYNRGAATEHYDDGLQHSEWLTMMRDRLILLQNLLHQNGVICVHIDDSEGAYLKVLLDEVFGREKHLTTFYVQVRYLEKTLKQDMVFHKLIEQVHCYSGEQPSAVYLQEEEYDIEKFHWYIKEKGTPKIEQMGGKLVEVFDQGNYAIEKGIPSFTGLKEIWATGAILDGNSSGRFFRDFLNGRYEVDGYGALYKVHGIGDDDFSYRYFTGPKKIGATKGKYYQGIPTSVTSGDKKDKKIPVSNFLDLAGSFGNCRQEGGVELRSGKKPELLLKTLIQLFSRQGDIVLDSFAGSGTTGSVAHKMGRRWIMVELGEHCHTHIIPRMKKVIDGEDNGGITEAVGWKGGGGFRYYRLAPTLLQKDQWDNWVINPDYNAEKLTEAVCKLEGFTYAPSDTLYWQHGHSTERDFLYVTTQTLTHEQMAHLSEDVGEDRTLLVCCPAWRGHPDAFP